MKTQSYTIISEDMEYVFNTNNECSFEDFDATLYIEEDEILKFKLIYVKEEVFGRFNYYKKYYKIVDIIKNEYIEIEVEDSIFNEFLSMLEITLLNVNNEWR